MIGVRSNTFNDNAGEPEQDANSALTELDKGLRSGKVGEQCEAIVRFPRLFEKYPFPILINSSFLKLADVFRMGNNFLRLWVLRVCQQSEKHLDKILNVDEFLRRIFSVLHSNDPVARALTLRTLGAVAGIIPERQNVHHAIRRGLDSHDNVEVDAAIYATTRFAAHSNTFAMAMCNKLSDMVECESTGAERRAKLVRALRTVHGGAIRAQGVLQLLHSLLERFPSSGSVRAAITTLTEIAADTVLHVPDQVELLLKLATGEAREGVRRAALVALRRLASDAARWPASALPKLLAAANQPDADVMLCLQVMQRLVKGGILCSESSGGVALREYCREAALAPRLPLAATAAKVLTDIALHCYEQGLPVEGADLMLVLEALVAATGAPAAPGGAASGAPDAADNVPPLRVALKCMVSLSVADPSAYALRSAGTVGAALRGAMGAPLRGAMGAVGGRRLALLEALAALGGAPTVRSLAPAMTHVLYALDCYTQSESPDEDGTALVLICTVIFQERAGTALTCKLNTSWEVRVLRALQTADGWTRYRVARAALRYGHHNIAATILKRLCDEAPTESAQRWLDALYRAANADATLLLEGITGLESCASGWEVSGRVAGWGAAVGCCAAGCAGCGSCCALRTGWVAARAQALAALARTAHAANALCTQPPPAIAHANAQGAREPSARSGACALALRKAARAVSAVADKYAAIARTAFHADDSTLRQLHISQHTYNQLAQFLERITSSPVERASELAAQEIKPATLEEVIALTASNKLAKISSKLFDNPTTNPGITHRHCEAVRAAVRACCVGCVWVRGAWCGGAGAGGAALCRVAVTPAPRAPHTHATNAQGGQEHAAALPTSHKLALKLEGVILPNVPISKRQKLREVKGVQVTVTATPHPRTTEKSQAVELTNIPPVLTAVQVVTPVRDFFSAQQLVSVNSPGLYTVAAECAFVDQRGELWNTGPRTAIVIKAHDDPNSKATVQTTRGRF